MLHCESCPVNSFLEETHPYFKNFSAAVFRKQGRSIFSGAVESCVNRDVKHIRRLFASDPANRLNATGRCFTRWNQDHVPC